MTNFFQSLGFVLLFLFSTYGVGLFISRIVYKDEEIGWAYTTTLGIAGWIIYGGVLNLFKIVTPEVLYFSLFAGFASAVSLLLYSLMAKGRADKFVTPNAPIISSKPWLRADNIFYYLLIFSVLTFCVYYLMPSSAFNFHDDFLSYFNGAVQLLAEGGFRSNPFSNFGYNILGGQDFMKAIPLLFFNVSYYNTFDAIICFVVGLALVIEIARKNRASFGVTTTAAVLFIFINPQIVNTSSVYSGTLLIMGLIMASFFQYRTIFSENNPKRKEIVRAVIPTACLYASLTVLKSNLIIFAVLFFSIKFLGEILFEKRKKLVLVSNTAVMLVSLLFVVPWLLSPSTKILNVFWNKIFSHEAATANNSSVETAQHAANKITSIFSTGDLFWGGSWPDYLAIFFVLVVIIIFNLFHIIKKEPGFTVGETLTISSASFASILSFLIVIRMGHTTETVLRYHIPFLIAILPISIIFFSRSRQENSKSLLINFNNVLIGITLIIIGMFTDSFIDRTELIIKQRHLISFPLNKGYYEFMQVALGTERKSLIKEAQSYVEEGAEVLLWASTPFNFDYKRNGILLFEGISGQFLPDFPVDRDVKSLWQFLKDHGIQYIIWEYTGPNVKSDKWYTSSKSRALVFAKTLFFKKSMQSLADHTTLIYNKNSIAVIDIREFKQTK